MTKPSPRFSGTPDARVAVEHFPAGHEPCPAKSDRALDSAILTAPSARDPGRLAKLDAVAGRVLSPIGKLDIAT